MAFEEYDKRCERPGRWHRGGQADEKRRDDFAKAALTGLLAGRTGSYYKVELAKEAWNLADKMIELGDK